MQSVHLYLFKLLLFVFYHNLKMFGSKLKLDTFSHRAVVLEILLFHAPYSLSSTQLHVTVSKTSVKVVLDCSVVGEKSVSAAGNITTDGVEILGRMLQSRGRRDNSAPVSMIFCLHNC